MPVFDTGDQACQCGPGHARPPDPPVSKTGILYMAEHQMLHELFDTTHKDAWKVLLKTGEVPPPISEDRGLSAKRLANLVSPLTITRCTFPSIFVGGF